MQRRKKDCAKCCRLAVESANWALMSSSIEVRAGTLIRTAQKRGQAGGNTQPMPYSKGAIVAELPMRNRFYALKGREE